MFLGASSPATKSRPRLIDLNLIPPEYRRRPFPIVTAGLAMLALGSLVLLYAIFYAKAYSDLEVSSLNARVAQARSVVQSATGDSAAVAQQDKLRAMRDDFHRLTDRQIHWGDVFQVVGAVPDGVIVKSASQSGFGVTITGSAANAAAASRYLEQLRGSGLFANLSLQMSPAGAAAAAAFATPTLVPTQPPPTIAPRSAPIALPPTSEPRAVSYPTPRPQPTAIPTEPRSTPTKTPTATITPTPTPAYDYVLVSSKQLPASNPNAGDTDIRGTVLDSAGKPFPGVPIEIDSEGLPPWTSTTTTGSDGTFDFTVTHGKFLVFPQSGHPQQALDLYTGADGVPGSFNYQLVFKATFTGTIAPTAVGTQTPTPTLTTIPTITPTPVAPGPNVASLGCASAYLVQNGVVQSIPGNPNPNQAIDGNLGTEWNAGIGPSNATQVIWQWSLPRPGTPINGCSASGLSDSQDQIDGFQLIPDQNPAGNTTHELWLYSDPGCTTNVATTNVAYYTWQGYTSAGQVLPLRIEPPLPIRCVIVRTLVDPSNVAWEEVQIFQELAPPGGFPTATVTPTISPTPTVSPAPTLTPSGPTLTAVAQSATAATLTATAGVPATETAVAALLPTATPTATPTFPNLWPHQGSDIAPCGIATASSGSNVLPPGAGSCVPAPGTPYSAAAAIDGNVSTYWVPVLPPATATRDPSKLTIVGLCNTDSKSSGYSCLLTPTSSVSNSISDVQVVVYAGSPTISENVTVVIGLPAPGQSTGYTCQLTFPPTVGAGSPTPIAGDGYPLDCRPPTAVPLVSSVSVTLTSNSPCVCEDGSFGVREIHIFTAIPGLGQGPGDAAPIVSAPVGSTAPSESTPPSQQSAPAADSPTPVAPTSGPVDFTIILEVNSGSGYP